MAWKVARNIGKRIKDLREAMGWTQGELGDQAGVAWTQVSAWENGHARPPRGRLERLAERNGWPVEIFADGGPSPKTAVSGSLMVREPGASYHAPVVDQGDWLSRGEDELEEMIRTVVRNVERTVRGMVTDTVSVRDMQLVLCRALIRQCESAGKPVPPVLTKVYNEVIEGRFK
jgi:transcriptional regulator with XRE-family HTH domain